MKNYIKNLKNNQAGVWYTSLNTPPPPLDNVQNEGVLF